LWGGAAGFIGAWTAKALTERGHRVVGVDNFTPYYDVELKRARVKALIPNVPLHTVDLADQAALTQTLNPYRFDQICHLGAQAGVRYSLQNPQAYESANNLGTLNVLEWARHHNTTSVVYASSSSVYGGNTKIPFSESDPVDRPVSLYAATKRYNELMAHTYHHLYGIHCTGLRFFTVYGPWGRPDMAYFSFAKNISEGRPIDVYNHGQMKRDFTFISDIVDGILSALDKDHAYDIFNLGHTHPVELSHFIACLEESIGRKAVKNYLPIQPGDVPATWADGEKSKKMLGFDPQVSIEDGIKMFVEWYRPYHQK
jgi:UDP-glucuronate 4-epimerase